MRGDEVIIKDLNSTNGTFINGNQITGEAVLKPGQTLRLGQVELRLDSGAGGPASAAGASAGAPAPAPKPGKPLQSTMVINKGLSAEQLVQGPQSAFDTTKGGFTKKSNKTNTYFIVGGIVFAVVILVLFGYLINMLNKK